MEIKVNKDIIALNDALHRQLSRLEDPNMEKEQIKIEIERTEAVTKISKEIISNGRLLLDVARVSESLTDQLAIPSILKENNGKALK